MSIGPFPYWYETSSYWSSDHGMRQKEASVWGKAEEESDDKAVWYLVIYPPFTAANCAP
jgi:hypothetical protein